MSRMGRIDRTQIVEAALELLDQEGLAGVTTRRVAERLGVKSSSLYWHFRDREELLDLLSDRIVADARWPAPTLEWREQVEALMIEYLRCLLAHRDAARVAAGRAPTGPHRLRGAETVLTALTAAGLSDEEAIDATLVLTTYVVGFALERDAAADAAKLASREPSHASEQYPTLTRLADLARGLGPSNRFPQGLALVLDGIAARLADSGRRGGSGREKSTAKTPRPRAAKSQQT
jgi:TetR/AcrR family transcriptional regulator, tetracycline repressor protein